MLIWIKVHTLIHIYMRNYPYRMTQNENIQDAINLFKKREGVLRTSEILAENVHPRTLYEMRDKGILIQMERLYLN